MSAIEWVTPSASFFAPGMLRGGDVIGNVADGTGVGEDVTENVLDGTGVGEDVTENVADGTGTRRAPWPEIVLITFGRLRAWLLFWPVCPSSEPPHVMTSPLAKMAPACALPAATCVNCIARSWLGEAGVVRSRTSSNPSCPLSFMPHLHYVREHRLLRKALRKRRYKGVAQAARCRSCPTCNTYLYYPPLK
eukprot:5706970-Pyramimonas_sp.AAC.1